MNSINVVVLTGRLGVTPEIRFTGGGGAVCNLRLAVNHSYKDKTGEWKEDVSWVDCVAWNKTAERAATYAKGDAILVEGRLSVRSFEKDGVKRYVTEVVANRIERIDIPKKAQADESDPF